MPIKNRRYTIKIDGLGTNGEGIGRVDGFTMFVEGALPGEVAEIIAVKLKKHYGYGKLVRVLTPSPERVTPVCPVFPKCGGCSLQNLSYSAQLKYKGEMVTDALKRIAGIECKAEPVIGMEQPFGYRNKAQFPVGLVDGRPAIGFYAGRSHRVVPVKECALQLSVNSRILTIVENFMVKNNIKPYDETTRKGLVRHVLTRIGFATGQIMTCIVINGKNLPGAAELIENLRQLDNMTGIVLNINRSNTNVILGDTTETLWGLGYITDCIGSLSFRISPGSFFQVNPAQTEVLYSTAAAFGGLTRDSVVVDAYCGIGTISLFIAPMVKKVLGIEVVPEAIADAKVNAELNGITNAEFICGAAETELPPLLPRLRPDVIILDPPRKGCDPMLIKAIADSGAERLVYVSCDPATMARDIKLLAGYELERVQPVDFFPMTTHVECVAALRRC